MRNENKTLLALGLCAGAGRLVYGTDMICQSLRHPGGGGEKPPLKRIVYVAEASDTSENTHKKLVDKCSFYGVRHIRLGVTMSELTRAVGKSGDIAAVAITDENLAVLFEKSLEI